MTPLILKNPQASHELKRLRDAKNRILKRAVGREASLEASILVRELEEFRIKHPQFAHIVMGWEVEVLDAHPGVSNV